MPDHLDSHTPTADDLRVADISAAARRRIPAVLRLARHLQGRIWLQRAVNRLPEAVTGVATLLAGWTVAVRSAWIREPEDGAVVTIIAVVSAIAAVRALAHRRRLFAAARLADRLSGAKDRFGTAIERAARAPHDDWTRLQAADADHFARSVRAAGLLPMHRPAGLPAALLACLCVGLGAYLPLPWSRALEAPAAALGPGPGLPGELPRLQPAAALLDRNDLELMQADAGLLAEVEEQVEDRPTRTWLRGLREVIEKVVGGRISRADAMAKLAELERKRPGADRGGGAPRAAGGGHDNADGGAAGMRTAGGERSAAKRQADRDRAVRKSVSRALEKSLEAAPGGRTAGELRRAAARGDMGAIGRTVRKLAEKAAAKGMSDRELDKWIRVAERFAGQLGDQKIPKKFEKLHRRIERLRSKRRRRGGLGSQDRHRLTRARREIRTLTREYGDVRAAGHTLERLRRHTRRAMNELRRMRDRSRLGKRGDRHRAQRELRRQRRQRFARSMRRASGELRRMSRAQKRRLAQRIGRSRIRQTRESLARAGRGGRSRRDFERRARAARHRGRGRPGRRKRMALARAGGRSAAERRAAARGRDRRRKRAVGFKLSEGDMPDDPRMAMMRRMGRGGQAGGGDRAGRDNGARSEGPGRKRIRPGRTERVRGIDSKGPTVKQVFIDTARKGFARKGWSAVYADYSEVAEEMIAREGLPVGRRQLVRRYFELIRPRGKGGMP